MKTLCIIQLKTRNRTILKTILNHIVLTRFHTLNKIVFIKLSN